MNPVIVSTYSSEWPIVFANEAEKIKHVLGDNLINMHHIGSTSVQDLPAKPIIDIVIETKDNKKASKDLMSLDYEERGEMRILFRQCMTKKSTSPNFHLHIYNEGNPEIELNVKFRDYLRTHPKIKQEYGELKSKLANDDLANKKSSVGYSNYNLGKNGLTKQILSLSGFDDFTIRRCIHFHDWERVHKLLGTGKTGEISNNNYDYIVLLKGTEIVSAALVNYPAIESVKIKKISARNNNECFVSYMHDLLIKWFEYKNLKLAK